MNKRTILFIWNKDVKHPAAGGGTWELFGLMVELVKRGYNVLFLTSRFPGAPVREEIKGVKVFRSGNMYTLFITAPIAFLLSKELRSADVIVEVMGFLPFLFPLFTRKPVIVLTWHLAGETYFIELMEKHGRLLGFILAAIAFFMEEVVFPLVYKHRPIITFSSDTKKDLMRLGFPKKGIKVYPLALSENIMSLSEEKGDIAQSIGPGPKAPFPLVLYLGRLRKFKGVQDAIRAMTLVVQHVPEAKLYIAGKGEYERKLRDLVRKLGLEEHVFFLGFIPVEEKFRLLKQAHILVMPSYKEGFATPILEANLCGTACVASDALGVGFLVKHGRTGLVYPRKNWKELARCVIKLLKNEELRRRMEKEALREAREFLHRIRREREKLIRDFERLVARLCRGRGEEA